MKELILCFGHFRRPFLRILCLTLVFGACQTKADDPIKKKERQIEVHLQEAANLARDGYLKDAAKSYQRVLQLDPESVPARRNLGLCLIKLGLLQKGIELLESIKDKLPQDQVLESYLKLAYQKESRQP